MRRVRCRRDLWRGVAAGVVTPYYSDDLVTIYHGDARDVMPRLSFDSVVTDPPYGTGFAAIVGDDAYPFDLLPVPSMPCIAFGSSRSIVSDLARFAVPPRRVMVWAPSFAWWKQAERGVMFRWTPIYCWDELTTRRNQEPHSDVFTDAIVGTDSRRTTSVSKPVPLMRRLLGLTTGTVLDPFAGRGSTVVAAKSLGRPSIAIEIDEAHCEIAANRCRQEVLGLSFLEPSVVRTVVSDEVA